jgi:hypothetical protein
MPSETYQLLRQAVRERHQLMFRHKGRPRQTSPVILGYAADGREVLFAWQFGGETSKGSKLPGWRCFYLEEMSDVAARAGRWFEGDSHTQAQTCVHRVDVDANIPDTLIEEEPLPFGSSKLRPPRQGE